MSGITMPAGVTPAGGGAGAAAAPAAPVVEASATPAAAPVAPVAPVYEGGGNVPEAKTNWMEVGAGILIVGGFFCALWYWRYKTTQYDQTQKKADQTASDVSRLEQLINERLNPQQ